MAGRLESMWRTLQLTLPAKYAACGLIENKLQQILVGLVGEREKLEFVQI